MADPYGFPPLEEQRCENCRYSRPMAGVNITALRCARHAPQISEAVTVAAFTARWGCWPAVLPENWCGEWCAKEGEWNG